MVVQLSKTSPASLRVVFSFGQSRQIRIELDIGFSGGDCFESHLAEIARIIDSSRYQQRLDPNCRDCDWHQVWNLIRRCHDRAMLVSGNLTTNIRIEDGQDTIQELPDNLIAGITDAFSKAV